MKNAISMFLVVSSIALVSSCMYFPVKNEEISLEAGIAKDFEREKDQQISDNNSILIKLGPKSRVYDFPEGKKYFTKIKLPEFNAPTFLAFKSYTEGALRYIKVFIPKFMFLDGNGKEIETAVSSYIISDEEFWNGTSYSGRVRVPEGAVAAVVYAADKKDAKPLAIIDYGKRWPVTYGKSGEFKLTLTHQQTVLVTDSRHIDMRGRTEFYVVSEVDGKDIRNAFHDSERASTKEGFFSSLYAVMTTRELPAQRTKVKITGSHVGIIPIQAIARGIAGDFLTITGEVNFEPEVGKEYVVNGVLKQNASAVWIEEKGTGKIVTDKIIDKDE